MDLTNNWSVISIFYRQTKWHILLGEFIRPMLKKLVDDGTIATYCLYLEKEKGEHIKVALQLSSTGDLNEHSITERLSDFLTRRPSETLAQDFPLPTLFLDFPNNSFYVDWYTANKLRGQHLTFPAKSRIQESVSKAILDSLNEDEITMETIYTFVVHMQLGLLHAVFPSRRRAVAEVTGLGRTFPSRFEDDDDVEDNSVEYDRSFRLLFEQNAGLLDEIIAEIWSGGGDESTSWLLEWQKACREIVGQTGFNELYFLSASVLFKQLGLPSNTMLTGATLRLIIKALERGFKPEAASETHTMIA